MGLMLYSVILTFSFVVLLVQAVFLYINARKNEKNIKSNEAIANTCITMCYIDLPSNHFEEIHSMNYIRNAIGKSGNAQEALNATCTSDFIVESYVPRMKEFVDLSTMEERLKRKKMISQEYEGSTVGWCRMTFTAVEYDKNGRLKSILYIVQPVQGEVLSLRDQLNIEETLIECVRTLSESKNVDVSINQLLANVAIYHNADRSYIFEFDKNGETTSNTYEWCKKGISPEIQNLKNLKMADIQLFLNLCKIEMLKLADINYFTKDSMEYQLLKQQNIESLMCMPLMKDGVMIGFMGVDNPKINRGTVSILQSVSSFVVTELEKRDFLSELYNLSFKDMMTEVYNRHANMRDIEELARGRTENIGIIYADVNGLKRTNDNFGHEQGDKLLIDAVSILKKYCNRLDDKIYRMGGDEFIIICSDIQENTLNEIFNNILNELNTTPILSIGKSWIASCSDIDNLIKTAEREMYTFKQQYYQSHDRRTR